MSEMVIVNGVRYQYQDAIKLGLVEPRKLEPVAVEPVEVPDVEAEEAVEAVVEPTKVPDDVEEAENETVADTTPGQPGGSRRKAPRRVN